MKPPNPWAALATTATLSQRLFKALDWPAAVRNSPEFPYVIASITYEADMQTGEAKIGVHYRWSYEPELTRDGVLYDKASEFPSPELITTLSLMAGPVAGHRDRWRAKVERETKKERLKAKYSDRPW